MKNEKGFTLVELVCSVALLSIITVASASFLRGVFTSQKMSKQMLYANNLAQETIETAIDKGVANGGYTYAKDGYKYYVEVSATKNPTVAGGSGGGGAGAGGGDSGIPDDDAPVITYKPSAPPKGTASPGKTPGPTSPIWDGEPGQYNMRVDFFDYIDEDLPMLIDAGKILMHDNHAPYTKAQILGLLQSHPDFAKYMSGPLAESAGESHASNLEKAAVCYRYATKKQVKYLTETVFEKRNTEFINKYNEYNLTDPNTFINYFDWNYPNREEISKNIANYFATLGDNPARGITKTYEAFNPEIIVHNEWWKDIVSIHTDIPAFKDVPSDKLMNIFNERIYQIYNYHLNSKERSGSQRGPSLIEKLILNNDHCISILSLGLTTVSGSGAPAGSPCYNGKGEAMAIPSKYSGGADIVFQLQAHNFNPYTFGNRDSSCTDTTGMNAQQKQGFNEGSVTWSWGTHSSDSPDTMTPDKAPLGIQLAAVKIARSATNPSDFYYKNNVLNKFTFYVTGGLSYQEKMVTAWFSRNFDQQCVDDDNNIIDYKPGVYYYKQIDYGAEKYLFTLADVSSPKWINFADDPSYQPPGSSPAPTPPGGDGGGGGIDHTVSNDIIATKLNFGASNREYYTVIVRENDADGKILATLSTYGKKFMTPTPTP